MVAVTESCSAAAWDAYVGSRPDATQYHRYAWRAVFERAFRHRCHYLAALDGERVVGVLPLVEFRSVLFGRFAVSLPFVNYGGLLADDDVAGEALLNGALARARAGGWRHVELRHLDRRCPDWPAKSHKVVMERPLEQTADALWAALDRKVRNQVRKAEKSGCTSEHGGVELLGDFYRVFAHNMRDLGTPVYTRRLFEEVLDACAAQSRVFVVRAGREPVAASIVLAWRERAEVPWASSLRAHAAHAPNMLLYWAMLRWCVEQGLAAFDFGRSTPGEGTYHFKAQWGAVARPTVWEYLGLAGAIPDQSPKNPKFRAAISMWQRVPVWLANRLGPPIVRAIP